MKTFITLKIKGKIIHHPVPKHRPVSFGQRSLPCFVARVRYFVYIVGQRAIISDRRLSKGKLDSEVDEIQVVTNFGARVCGAKTSKLALSIAQDLFNNYSGKLSDLKKNYTKRLHND